MNRRIILLSIVSIFGAALNSAHALKLSVVNGIEGPKDPQGNRTFYFPIIGTTSCPGSPLYPYPLTDPLTGNQRSLQVLSPTTDNLIFSISSEKPLSTISPNFTNTGSMVVIRVESGASGEAGQFYATTQPTGVGYNGSSSGDPTKQNYGTIDHQVETFGFSLGNNSSVNGYCSYLQNKDQLSNCQVPSTQSIQTSTRFNIGLVQDGNFALSGNNNADFVTVNIVVANCPPSGITPSFSVASLDSAVKITDNVNTSSTIFPVPLKDTIVFGAPQASSFTPGLNASIQQVVSNSPYRISQLANDTAYCFTIGYTNLSGFISTPLGNANPNNNCATPSKIDGFLNKNACFIATAAYDDLEDPRLELLRKFRDEILSPLILGRKFIEWYYSWSPRAAHWILDHPAYKRLVKIGLLPVLGIAKTTLWIQNNMWANETIQPYLDSLKEKYRIPEKPAWSPPSVNELAPLEKSAPDTLNPEPTPENIQPYIESFKRTHGLLTEAESPPLLPPSYQPYIETLKINPELKPKYEKKVHQAAGIAVVVANKFDINSATAQANTFNTVYNPSSKYAISFDFFYEYQFLRDRTFGSLGPVFHLGIVTLSGNGVFTKSQVPSNDVHFQFYMIPLSAGLSYRFLLGRFFVPFAELSAVGIPFFETRDDSQPSHRGISKGYTAIGGIAFNLDWISRKNAWEQYDSYGVLHTSLVAQLEYLTTFASTVNFTYTAGYAGFMFEF